MSSSHADDKRPYDEDAIVFALAFTGFATNLFAGQILESRRITLRSLPRAAVVPAVLESHAITVGLAFHTAMPSQSRPQPAGVVPVLSRETYWTGRRIALATAMAGGAVALKALGDCTNSERASSDGCAGFFALGLFYEAAGAVELIGPERIEAIPPAISRPIHWVAVGRGFLRR